MVVVVVDGVGGSVQRNTPTQFSWRWNIYLVSLITLDSVLFWTTGKTDLALRRNKLTLLSNNTLGQACYPHKIKKSLDIKMQEFYSRFYIYR